VNKLLDNGTKSFWHEISLDLCIEQVCKIHFASRSKVSQFEAAYSVSMM